MTNGTGRFEAQDVLGAGVEPIRNPVTGATYRAAIKLHDGFEFREGEMASSTFWSKGELDQKHKNCYGVLSYVTYGPHGIIDGESPPQ